MPQMMGPGRLHTGGNRQLELWDELMKDMADGLRAEGTGFLSRDRQEGMCGLERAADLFCVMEISCYASGQVWSKGHQTALGEFGLADDQQLPDEIDILAAQAGDLPDAEPQGIHQRQGELVGGAAIIAVRPLPQVCGRLEETLGLGTVKDEGPARWRTAPGLALQRRLDEYLVEDQPAEEAAQGTQQGVDAAWLAGMRQHKGLQHRWCDRLQGRHLLDEQVALQLT